MSRHWYAPVVRRLRAAGLDVRRLAPGVVLLARSGAARAQWQTTEKALGRFTAQEHVAHLLGLYRVNCVVDVGANHGQYATALRRGGYTGHIASFEPVPAVFEQLRGRAASDPRWEVYPYALGRDDGTTVINVVPGTLSSVLPATRFGRGRYTRLREPTPCEVPLRRLDGLLDELLQGVDDPRPYLKLDTQGYDLEVFAGLGERVGDFVGLQAEVALLRIYEGMPRMAEAIDAYEAAGFEISGMFPVSRQSRTARVLELDCMMVRAGAL